MLFLAGLKSSCNHVNIYGNLILRFDITLSLCIQPPPWLLGAESEQNRIIGGVEVSPYSIKYQASLFYSNSHFCGGTLVHPQWVVSAAHCWRP